MMQTATQEPLAIQLSQNEFNRIQNLIYNYTGIVVDNEKREFVRARIVQRLQELGLATFDQYCDFIESGDESNKNFVSLVTTNHTSFFRESHQLETLIDHLKTQDIKDGVIWSAGCSSGEEPYSIAICLGLELPHLLDGGLRIIASDIDDEVLCTARTGVYPERRISKLDSIQLKYGFNRGTGANKGMVQIKQSIRQVVEFQNINLMEEFPIAERIPLIFCRNVVIYFDRIKKSEIFSRFANLQEPGDLLFIGHSENLNGISTMYRSLGRSTYVRI